MPVDIEIGGERRVRPIFENIHPPRIFAAGCHVIRHDIQQQSHAAVFQFAQKLVKISFCS